MATDIFIKIDGIDGESADKNHGKWIDVITFAHGAEQSVSGNRNADVSGRGHFIPFSFIHSVDKATPKIQQFCMSGQKIAKVEFVVCRAVAGAQVPVYEITMENVKICKANVVASDADGKQNGQDAATAFAGTESNYVPVETVTLIPGKMTWKQTSIKPDNTKDGAVEASFNQVENA